MRTIYLDIEMLQRLCTDVVLDKFLELGHFTDYYPNSNGLTLRDWIKLDDNFYYKGHWNRYCEAEEIGTMI